jgi:hypothetical protein
MKASLIEFTLLFRNVNSKTAIKLSARQCPTGCDTNSISRRQRIEVSQQTFAQQKQKIKVCEIEKH